MTKSNVLVFSGYGLNSEEEALFAFKIAGAKGDIIHVNDIIDNPLLLKKYQIAVFPGGFAHGDDTGSGNAYAQKIKNTIFEPLKKFVYRDTLTIGFCNGCQILSHLGLMPALDLHYGERQTALLHNAQARYNDRWVDLKVENDSPWLSGISDFPVCVSHGEGRFFMDEKTLKKVGEKGLVALRYVKGAICDFQSLPHNPNGAIADIAGITDESKRVLGLMPHPERSFAFTNLPNWTYLREVYKREGRQIPKYAPSLQVFRNAVEYFQ